MQKCCKKGGGGFACDRKEIKWKNNVEAPFYKLPPSPKKMSLGGKENEKEKGGKGGFQN